SGRLMRDVVAVIALGVLLVLGWQVIVWVGDYPRFVLPGPLVVAQRWQQAIIDGTIQKHLWTTLSEVLLGLLVGVSTGFVTGFLLARSAFAERLLSPYIVAAQATPILALAPLIAI